MTFFVQKCHTDPTKILVRIGKLGNIGCENIGWKYWVWKYWSINIVETGEGGLYGNFRTYFGTVSTPDLGWMSSKLKSLKKSFEEFRCILDLTFILNSKTTSNDFKWPQLHKRYHFQISELSTLALRLKSFEIQVTPGRTRHHKQPKRLDLDITENVFIFRNITK